MHLSDLPVEDLKNICSFLGGDAYVANMVPYLRSCIEKADRKEFLVEVYKRGDFASIYLYDLFPSYDIVERCVSAAVEKENLTILYWLLAKSKNKLLLMIAEQAALHGSYLVLTWAMHVGVSSNIHVGVSSNIQKGCLVTQKMVTDVIRAGNNRLYKLLHFLGHRYSAAILCASYYDNLEVLSLSNIKYYMDDVLRNSAMRGNLETLKRFQHMDVFRIEPTMQGAYSTLQREMILYFKDEHDLGSPGFLYSALSGGTNEKDKLDFLEFLDSLVKLDYDQIVDLSPCLRYINIVKWCLQKGARANSNMFISACVNSVQDMDYLDSLGCYREDSMLYFSAIESRKVENLQWLKDRGCPIPQGLTRHVLRNKGAGSLLPCFEWCLKQGLEFSIKLLQDCILQDEMDTFHWLLDKVNFTDEYAVTLAIKASINKPNLEAFSVLYIHDSKGVARAVIEEKKKTFSNYLLLEEMERLLA